VYYQHTHMRMRTLHALTSDQESTQKNKMSTKTHKLTRKCESCGWMSPRSPSSSSTSRGEGRGRGGRGGGGGRGRGGLFGRCHGRGKEGGRQAPTDRFQRINDGVEGSGFAILKRVASP
jgi:hypothetical protein